MNRRKDLLVSEQDQQRNWPRRVRAVLDRKVRTREGVVFVEGIRQVLAAGEGGFTFEAIFVDASRLRSEIAWEFVNERQAQGEPLIMMRPSEFERISTRDNPVGIAALVRWQPLTLPYLEPEAGGIYLATDNVRDPGNLGTLARTSDALGVAGLIVHRGTDPGHPTALRASLGSIFGIPVAAARNLNEFFHWANSNGIAVVATTAHAEQSISDAQLPIPAVILLGNEGEGLATETRQRCDLEVTIPMRGSATSLNVSVAGGILLYEFQRRLDGAAG